MIETPPEILSESARDGWQRLQASIWQPEMEPGDDDTQGQILRGLLDQPRRIDPKFLYDERGSQLFERICDLPEYYPTRTEEKIISENAERIIAQTGVDHIVELGAGFSTKTVHLLSEQVLQKGGGTFAPVDVSLTALKGSRESVTEKFPEIEFAGLHTSYEEGIASIEASLATLFVFLGGSVGNFERANFSRFFRLLERCMGPDDYFLLGVDRTKPKEILEKAYDDSEGLTARFILNVFDNVNRLVASNFKTDLIRFSSHYNSIWRQIEMYGIATSDQEITLPLPGERFLWREDERILVEISRKFDPIQLSRELGLFGLETVAHYTDPREWFSLLLLKKRSG